MFTRFARICTVVVTLAGMAVPVSARQTKPRIAVLTFQNNSDFGYWKDELGLAATDELVTQLVGSGAFTVIERQQVDAILAEQHFGLSGAVDASTAAEIGRILGVQALLIGSITQFSIETKSGGIGPLSASYTQAESAIDARLVSTETAEIMLVAEGKGDKKMGGFNYKDVNFSQRFNEGVAQEALRPAVEEAVQEIVAQQSAVAALAPVEMALPAASVVGVPEAGSVYIDRGEGHGVEIGQRFDVYRVVDEIRDASGNVLDQITEKVGAIEVTRVLSQSAVGTVVEGDAREGDTVRGD